MGTRWFLVGLLAVAVACKGTSTSGTHSTMDESPRAAANLGDRDATERALMHLGIDARILRHDLNRAGGKRGRIVIRQTHLLSDLILLETSDAKPNVYAIRRDALEPRWQAALMEPTEFRVGENEDTVLLVSAHYLHALAADSGRRAMEYVEGALQGLARPPLLLPFSPTGGAAAQPDTVYVPSLGSPGNNKTIESFSLITGQRGWGYRTLGNILTSPAVGGSRGDPKLYFVTDQGALTCLDAARYAFGPRAPRWEMRLDSGCDLDFFLTDDTKAEVGALYLVDRRGVVYCVDRITGTRRWLHATGRRPAGAPRVFGNVCVVPLQSGLCGFDKDNVGYTLTVKGGPDDGKTFHVRKDGAAAVGSGGDAKIRVSGPGVAASHATLEIQGEVLHVAPAEGKRVLLSGRPVQGSSRVLSGDDLALGGVVLAVTDHGTQPLWRDLPYDEIVARIGDKLVARAGRKLSLLDAYTGEAVAGPVDIPSARLFPANTKDANLYIVGGDAVLYTLYPR
ncbi:MAG: PQQ-binding-like beta-propeller repeat protein [Planctomycetota bacterium]